MSFLLWGHSTKHCIIYIQQPFVSARYSIKIKQEQQATTCWQSVYKFDISYCQTFTNLSERDCSQSKSDRNCLETGWRSEQLACNQIWSSRGWGCCTVTACNLSIKAEQIQCSLWANWFLLVPRRVLSHNGSCNWAIIKKITVIRCQKVAVWLSPRGHCFCV